MAVNKTDVKRAREAVSQFYELGLDPIFEVSAEHGTGVSDLLDEVVRRLPGSGRARKRTATAEPPPESTPPQATQAPTEVGVAIVGRPNAGKSSLVNRLLKEERMIVSEMPGTTRDTVDTVMRWHRRDFRIVDTAGIRRPGRVSRGGQVETLSVLLARRAIERADVVVLVVDANAGVTDQDAAIAGEADKAGRGIIIVANKWDLMKGRGPEYSKEFDEELRRQLKFLDYAPVLHISAATGERTPKLLEAIDRVAEARHKRVPTGELNRYIATITAAHPPASPGRREVRILYAAQTNVAPPTFVCFTNVATTLHFSYDPISREPVARSVWIRGHANPHSGAQARALIAGIFVRSFVNRQSALVTGRVRAARGRVLYFRVGPDPDGARGLNPRTWLSLLPRPRSARC